VFGINKRVERVRAALVHALNKRAFEIMLVHRDKPASDIPPLDLARSRILMDIAEVLKGVDLGGDPDETEQ
jgi:hypothetical protein